MTPEKKSLPEESSDTDEALPPQRKLRSSSKNRDQSDEVIERKFLFLISGNIIDFDNHNINLIKLTKCDS